MVKRAHGYLRVSKDPRLEKLSPEVQRHRISQACWSRRWELAEIHEDIDVPSAKIQQAGTWDALVDSLQEGDVVVTCEFTRIGRNLRQTLERIDRLHEKGAELVSLEGDLDTTTAAGKLQYQILLVLAEFERNRMSERLQDTHAQIAREGRWSGGPTPFGYSYTPGMGLLQVVPEEARVVREIFHLRDSGFSIYSIIRELEDRRTRRRRTRGGVRFSYSTIQQVLKNPVYIGMRSYKGALLPANHESIIEKVVWDRVQARRRQAPKSNKYLLSGMLTCGVCGSTMTHKSEHRYVCSRAQEYRDTTAVTILERSADAWVLQEFFAKLDDKRYLRARARTPKPKPNRDLKKRLSQVEASLERLLADQYGPGDPPFTAEQFRERNAELLEQRRRLLSELQTLEDNATLNVVRITPNLHESWDNMNLDEQREALRLFVERIIIKPGRTKERVEIRWRF
jgi:site-specific DNA recombinase